jgi:eukaryotic-like serine/threonine-protein kinase
MPERTSYPDLPRYEIFERIRSDALTGLYRARQIDLSREVAIRVLRDGVLPSSPFATTLEREARLLSELDHPNIPRLYDFQREGGRMWFVLEKIDGAPLDEILTRHGALPPLVATAIALSLAQALGHAHERGVMHRDLRPRNVFIAPTGRVKLLGFSVATDSRLPTAPELIDGAAEFGPPHYMSPEQVLGEPPDPRSDLFSLGGVLYEMLTRRRPFDAPDSRAVTQRIRHDAPAPLSREARNLPRHLEDIVQRLLQKLPSDRYESARAAEDALAMVLGPRRHESEQVIREHLQPEARLEGQTPSVPSTKTERAPRLLTGLFASLALLVVGGGAIQYMASRRGGGSVTNGSPLALVPTRGAELRVVVEPWAHVIVDGQRIDTTPFARPIPLPAGTHYVRLEHPDAPTVRRTVHLTPGETVLLDIRMDLPVRAESPKTLPAEPPVTSEPDTP